MASPSPPKQIIILGAGVSGLQTALSLLTTPSTSHYEITIIASHIPGDLSPEYTSPWAGGHWRSHVTDPVADAEVMAFDKRTYEFWTRLLWGEEKVLPEVKAEDYVDNGEDLRHFLMSKRAKEIGLGFRESRNFWGMETAETPRDGSGLWWRSVVSDFQILDLEKEKTLIKSFHALLAEKQKQGAQTIQSAYPPKEGISGIPSQAIFGIKYKSVCINVPKYLEWLFKTATKSGAKVVKADVDVKGGLEGVIVNAKKIFAEREGTVKEGNIFALINCTGLSARHFVGDEEAQKLYPIRGQTILVKGECALARTFTDISPTADPSELVYVVPRPGSGTTIIGGCKQVGNWSEHVDEELSKRILGRVKGWGLAEDLRGADGEFEVLSTQVGFRPGRKGGPRVEVQNGGKVGDIWVVHAYGHSGGGYQASVGSAEKVVGLVEGL